MKLSKCQNRTWQAYIAFSPRILVLFSTQDGQWMRHVLCFKSWSGIEDGWVLFQIQLPPFYRMLDRSVPIINIYRKGGLCCAIHLKSALSYLDCHFNLNLLSIHFFQNHFHTCWNGSGSHTQECPSAGCSMLTCCIRGAQSFVLQQPCLQERCHPSVSALRWHILQCALMTAWSCSWAGRNQAGFKAL